MGFSLKSVFRAPKKIVKAAKKVVKSPLFPIIAGIAGPAALGAYGAGAGAGGIFSAGGALGSMGARAALSNAIAQAAQGDGIDAKQIALQGIVSQLGAMGSAERDSLMRVGAEGIEGVNLNYPNLGETPSMLTQAKNLGIRAAGAVGDYVAPQDFKSMTTGDLVTNLKNIGSNVGSVAAATAINPATAEIMIDLNQQSIDDYNNSLLSSGMKDKGERRTAIFDYFIKNGYEEDKVNVMLDKYGYADGGITTLKRGLVDQAGSYAGFDIGKAEGTAFARSIDDVTKLGRDEDEENEITLVQDKDGKLKIGKSKPSAKSLTSSLQIAADAVEDAFGRPLEMKPVEFKRFATGGEVEIEEQVDDLGIMDLMRDQGVEYGEQVSNAQNDELLEKLFEEFIDLGFSPEDAARKAREAFDDMSQGQGIKGTQVASGYKDDIEEMYEQYVFEMEEQGLQPMDFASYLRQARSGMAKGGMMKGPDWFTNRVEQLMYQGLSYEEASQQAYDEGHGGGYQDGGIMNKNLLNTGMDKDMRGGGFIPEGTKEKADDVPARLSKNEFVMTADAVRAAGGGSVNEGAKRMYETMHKLEAKV